MSTQENKDLIRRFYETLNSGNLSNFDEFIADNYVSHSVWENPEGFKKAVTALRAAYPDLEICIDDLFAEEDKVVVRGKIQATQKTISYIGIHRIANGKIVEHWAHSDSFF